MITRLIWTIWIPMFSVPQKMPINLICLPLAIPENVFENVSCNVIAIFWCRCMEVEKICTCQGGGGALQWRHNERDGVSNHQRLYCSTVGSGADQRKNQRSASLAFVRGIHRWPVNSPHKRPVTRKMLPFDDVIMSEVRVGVGLCIIGCPFETYPNPNPCQIPFAYQCDKEIG